MIDSWHNGLGAVHFVHTRIFSDLDPKVLDISIFMSADLYSDLTIGLGIKNYPKLTPHMLKSIHRVQNYWYFNFHIS